MEAIEAYYYAIDSGHLPATVPCSDEEGNIGIATQILPLNDEAKKMAFSLDWAKRAEIAVWGLAHARNVIKTHHPELVAS